VTPAQADPYPPEQPKPASPGKAVLKAGSICFLVAVVSIIAQPVLLVFIHGPLIAVCTVLAIIAIAKDQVKGGVQLLVASICILPIIFALSLFLWSVAGIGALASFGSSLPKTRFTTSVGPSPPQLVRKQTPASLDSLKDKFLDQIRAQSAVSIADFRTDQEIEIELQPEANFDPAKAKSAALTIAKGWQQLSGQTKVSVSIWQGANLLARESRP